MKTSTAIAIVLSGLVLASSVEAADFFGGPEDGWFWYRDPPPEEAVEPEVAAAPPAAEEAPPAEPAIEPPAAPMPPPGPAPLSAAWFRENLDHYRDAAIDNPTPENVRAFLLLQKVVMDKASDFTAAAQMVTIGDPFLDATAERPLATVGVHAVERAAAVAEQSVLQDLAKSAGLLFFFRSDCPNCHAMAPVVAALRQRLGFPVVAVSVDGGGLGDGLFPDFQVDRGQAQVLGIQSVPSLFVVRPPDQILPLAEGAMAQDSIQKRILMVARQAGWITQDAYDATLAIRRRTRVPELRDLDAATLSDPAALNEYLRSNMTLEAPQ